MFSKAELAGYVMIDHRDSPGFSCEQVGPERAKYFGAGKVFEGKTLKCSHCEKQVIQNPDRLRHRGHCFKCDKYLCDQCAVVYKLDEECRSFDRFLDGYFTAVAHGKNTVGSLERWLAR